MDSFLRLLPIENNYRHRAYKESPHDWQFYLLIFVSIIYTRLLCWQSNQGYLIHSVKRWKLLTLWIMKLIILYLNCYHWLKSNYKYYAIENKSIIEKQDGFVSRLPLLPIHSSDGMSLDPPPCHYWRCPQNTIHLKASAYLFLSWSLPRNHLQLSSMLPS